MSFEKAKQQESFYSIPFSERFPVTEVRESSGKRVYMDQHQAGVINSNKINLKYSPSTSVPTTAFTAATSFDIKIERYRAVCKGATLRVDLAETGGSNSVTPIPPVLAIQRIEWLANGGSTLIQTQYGEQIFWNYGTLSDEQMAHLNAVGQISS